MVSTPQPRRWLLVCTASNQNSTPRVSFKHLRPATGKSGETHFSHGQRMTNKTGGVKSENHPHPHGVFYLQHDAVKHGWTMSLDYITRWLHSMLPIIPLQKKGTPKWIDTIHSPGFLGINWITGENLVSHECSSITSRMIWSCRYWSICGEVRYTSVFSDQTMDAHTSRETEVIQKNTTFALWHGVGLGKSVNFTF